MTAMRIARVVAVALLGATVTLGWVPPARGQATLGGFNVEADVEAGYRYFLLRPSPSRRAKFEEYRDIDETPFLNELQLRFFRPDESYSSALGAARAGQDDQEYSLRAGRLGLWGFGFDWDQTPHVLFTTTRIRAEEVSRGEWRLPPRPTATPISPAEGALYNAAPEREIGVRWDTARAGLVLTPTPGFELRLEATRIKKDGDRPFGISFGSPGNDFMEVLEPIDHTIYDVRLRGTVARDRWQLVFGYTFNMFENAETRVIVDNPLRGTFGAFTPSAAGGSSAPAFAQASLPPGNYAHTIHLGGGVDLPLRTRLNLGFSYSLRIQDGDNFLPHTVNPILIANAQPGSLDLPKKSLEGIAGITAVNLNLVNRAIPGVTLGLRYRLFKHDEMTDELVFPAHVVNDLSLVNEPRASSSFDHERHNVDLDARFRLIPDLATTIGGGWERWNRNEVHREVPRSDEVFARAAFDYTPTDWLLTRLTYRPSWRRISEYNTFAHIAHTVVEEELEPLAAAQSQSLLLRKFDEGARDRQQVDLTLQFTPWDTVTVSLNGAWRNDDYLGGRFGLRDATTWSAGFDLTWAPVERLAFFAGYVYEDIFQKFRSRNRDVVGTQISDFDDWDWLSSSADRVHTVHLGANVTLIPRRLHWTIQGNYAHARGNVDTRNVEGFGPHPPAFVALTNPTARRQPPFEDTLFRLDTALRYWITKQLALSLGYAFESFQKNDWRTEGLNPFVPGSNSIYLGNDTRNYAAHLIGATLRYSFR